MSNLQKRLEALEKRFAASEPLRLTMRDGRVRTIPLPGRNGLWRFYGQVIRGERPREAELLRDCVEYTEPGGGHMINLLKVMVDAPVETGRHYTSEEADMSE